MPSRWLTQSTYGAARFRQIVAAIENTEFPLLDAHHG